MTAAVFPLGAEEVLEGQGVNGDWQTAAPGVEYRITVPELPPPFATESAQNGSKIVARPPGAMPQVPEGFAIPEFASGFKNPRYLLTAPNGDIFVTESGSGEIRVLRDSDNDGKADVKEVFASGLDKPFGLAFYPPGPDPKYLYVANADSIGRFPPQNGDQKARSAKEMITSLSGGGQLTGGGHWARDIVFSKGGKKLFASVGSHSNVNDDAAEEGRACIFEMNPDGTEKRLYGTGIRNAVGIAIHPETGDLWASVNERDGLGDDLVPEYITRVQDGGFYGWPWYYLGNHPDPRRKDNPRPKLADKVIVPDVLVQAHSASLNLVFYDGAQFPKEYQGDAFAAFHGSWNRATRTGYKVVRVPLKNCVPSGVYQDFVTGFVTPDANVWGRPVDLTEAKDGSLLMSEDGYNTIWRISAKPAQLGAALKTLSE